MALVQKANVLLEINDELINEYLNKGYNQVDETGKVIREGIPINLNQLRLAYVRHKKLINQLEKEVEELNSQLVKLKKASKKN